MQTHRGYTYNAPNARGAFTNVYRLSYVRGICISNCVNDIATKQLTSGVPHTEQLLLPYYD